MQIPISHLFVLLKKAVNFPIFNSFVILDAIDKTMITIVIGSTNAYIMDTIFVEKKATAGRHTDAVTAPPLADIKVNIKGKTNCICVCMAEMHSNETRKHSVKTTNNGINAAA